MLALIYIAQILGSETLVCNTVDSKSGGHDVTMLLIYYSYDKLFLWCIVTLIHCYDCTLLPHNDKNCHNENDKINFEW